MTTAAELRATSRADMVASARAAYAAGDWAAGYASFSAASALGPLTPEDLDAMATAAWRLGRLGESARLAELVFTRHARRDPVAAGEKAVGLALIWLTRGDSNLGRTWMERARELITGALVAPVHAYLAYLDAAVAADAGRDAELRERVRELSDLEQQLAHPEVTALGLVAQAREALSQGSPEAAFELLDRAVSVVGADPSTIEWVGEVHGVVVRHTRGAAEIERSDRLAMALEDWLAETGLAGLYRGWAAHTRGVLRVRGGDHRRALESLGVALREYRVLRPHGDTADVYEWMTLAHRGLGDSDAADADVTAAAAIRRQLGG